MVPVSPTQPRALLHVFNRYLFRGGEELIVDKIHDDLSTGHNMTWCRFESSEWTGAAAPSKLGQAARLFYNRGARRRFETALDASGAGAAVFHNIHPVGSPSLYHAALERGLPLVQFLHNYRPFSVGGTLHVNGRLEPNALYGNYWDEVRAGAWQNSVVKSALFAVMLKALHRSGWLQSVKAWVAVSDFMRQKLIATGSLPADRVHTLRHSWNALPRAPTSEDAGYYLFLGRLADTKGVTVLLDAWDRLRQQLGKNTPLLHIAGEGPLEDAVQQRVRTNPYIGQLGHVGGETKREALRRCRAVIVPSTWWEPLGLVVYEAYDYSKPVLAAKSGGLGEIVHHGVTGLHHEPGDADSIVHDVQQMESTPASTRQTMGSAGRQWLLRETGTHAWLQRFEEILATAVATA
ncbi:glycosyltransferase family 4 protein [Prosthecobacter sp.]|uniref:glycosyltransferase family 4 protein n=1 Tax=Prosthecobacter sp. TaxID=1965333 RepID=UPI001D8B7591|nr:glycosyltransferase family 4 protein [Prosthecobacter sp.]MCB1277105.1 glycosyltransferase family 4 protein [Prosthecobacter sp.]